MMYKTFSNFFNKHSVSYTVASIIASLFIIFANNLNFWNRILYVISPSSLSDIVLIINILFVLTLLNAVFLNLCGFRYIFKPFVVFNLLVSAIINYFLHSYGTIINDDMIRNVVQTDKHEVLDLITWEMIIHISLFGIVPSFLFCLLKINDNVKTLGKNLLNKLLFVFFTSLFITGSVFIYYKDFSITFRTNKDLRYYVVPLYQFYAAAKYFYNVNNIEKDRTISKKKLFISKDIKNDNQASNSNKGIFVVFVVGEAARAKNFSLSSEYSRNTTPLLKNEKEKGNLLYFSNFYSCGTSTGESLPCMFTHIAQKDYSVAKAEEYENLLHLIAQIENTKVIWIDNNSGSKGIAKDFEYVDYSELTTKYNCSEECYDEVMLNELKSIIADTKNDKSQNTQNIFVVLHQKGSHGPAYYKRYPKEFEMFKNTCQTSFVNKCDNNDLINTYDNTILYTDYFLHSVIDFLKIESDKYDTAMVYSSDHGESLNDNNNGIYLHGLPYSIAPKEQKHIPMFIWFSNDFIKDHKINMKCLLNETNNPYSHDNLFHLILKLYNIKSNVYDSHMDILTKCEINRRVAE